MDGRYAILFVCLGNICRSPAAEGVFRHLLARYEAATGGAGAIGIDSAGTIGFHAGNPPDARMRAVAARRGYDLDGAARAVRVDDFRRFDLILGMDANNVSELRDMKPRDSRAEVALFATFTMGVKADVPDPYYGGSDGFETVLDLLEKGCRKLIARLEHDGLLTQVRQ